jgi:hypothetical protein
LFNHSHRDIRSNSCLFPVIEDRNRASKAKKMADADGKMKDLSVSETKKNKKDGTPKTAAKKPQQQKKKVGLILLQQQHSYIFRLQEKTNG